VLRHEVEVYDPYPQRMAECDQQLQKHLAQFADKLPPQPPEAERELQKENPARKRRKPQDNAPRFNLNGELQRITGVDLTQIDSVDVLVAQTIISEVGLDMSRWKTEAHFASWLGLCPGNRISGDKVLRRGLGTWSTAPPTRYAWLPTS
jgi:transposase